MSSLKQTYQQNSSRFFLPITVFKMVVSALKILKQNNYIFINISKTHKPQESEKKPELTSSVIKNIKDHLNGEIDTALIIKQKN